MQALGENTGHGLPFMGEPEKYPVAIVVQDGLWGWHDRMDRAAHYVTFAEFVAKNNGVARSNKNNEEVTV